MPVCLNMCLLRRCIPSHCQIFADISQYNTLTSVTVALLQFVVTSCSMQNSVVGALLYQKLYLLLGLFVSHKFGGAMISSGLSDPLCQPPPSLMIPPIVFSQVVLWVGCRRISILRQYRCAIFMVTVLISVLSSASIIESRSFV